MHRVDFVFLSQLITHALKVEVFCPYWRRYLGLMGKSFPADIYLPFSTQYVESLAARRTFQDQRMPLPHSELKTVLSVVSGPSSLSRMRSLRMRAVFSNAS